MSEEEARDWLERFKRHGRTFREFCVIHKIHGEGLANAIKSFFPDEWSLALESNHPKQTMYRLGRALEYRVMKEAKDAGYFTLRAPASKGSIDVIAIKPGTVLFIQCKRGGYVGREEWNEVYEVAQSASAIPVIASCPTGRGTRYVQMTAPKTQWKKGTSKQPEPSISFTL